MLITHVIAGDHNVCRQTQCVRDDDTKSTNDKCNYECQETIYAWEMNFFYCLTLNFVSETAMPQRRNHTARSPYGDLAMAVRWHTVFTLSWLPRKSYGGLTVSLRWPRGALTATVLQTYSNSNNREVAVRSPPGLLAVTLRFLISWIVRSPCGDHNICDHNYRSLQDLTIFKNHVLQAGDRRTVRRPYGGSMICDRGISEQHRTMWIWCNK